MSSEVSPSARHRVAQVLGASAMALSSSRVCEQIGGYSLMVVRMALAHLTQEGAASRRGTQQVPLYSITASGREQYLGEHAPPLADANAWQDRRNGWTGARVDELRLLCAKGHSFSDIAVALGGGLSRNACIGKARRIGIPNRIQPVEKTEAMRRPRKAGTKTKPKTVRREKSFTVICAGLRPSVDEYADQPRELPAEAIPLEQRKQVIDLEPNHCRFPYGTPGMVDFFFCGGEAVTLQPYCPYHCGIAFNGLGRPPQRNSYNFEKPRKIY